MLQKASHTKTTPLRRLLKQATLCLVLISFQYELIKNVSDELRAEHREVPWKAIAGMRDLAAHKYQTLRMEDVYRTAKDDFPALKKMLETILDAETGVQT